MTNAKCQMTNGWEFSVIRADGVPINIGTKPRTCALVTQTRSIWEQISIVLGGAKV